jgi:hypothetical protein
VSFISSVTESATVTDVARARYLWEPVDDVQSANWTPVPTM